MEIALASVFVFVTIFIIPIFIYGLFASHLGLEEPEKKTRFFIGVIIQKIATTFGFVALFVMAQGILNDQWLTYGLVWFAMFAVTEIGQTYLTDYSRKEAIAGIISEAVYFPLAAYILYSMLQ